MNAQLEGFYHKLYVDSALQQGYRFSLDEAREFGAQLEELPDDMLDVVSAGNPVNANGQASGI